MKTTHNKMPGQKRKYAKPRLERVQLDNEISMVMLSTPPGDPTGSFNPLHLTDNPFKLPNL